MQILVVGMHRSGTSAVCRLLNMMGAYFGPEGSSTDKSLGEENPKGFWERRDFRELNDLLLRAQGADWDQVSGWNAATLDQEVRQNFTDRAKIIITRLDAMRPWVAKEPRFCLTLPLWLPLLEVPMAVLVYRNPLEVAQSLLIRNAMPLAVGCALWEYYNKAALSNLIRLPVVWLSHASLMADPMATVAHLHAALLRHGAATLRLPSALEIHAFLDPRLHRQKAPDDWAQRVTPEQRILFCAMEKGQIPDHEPLPPQACDLLTLWQETRRLTRECSNSATRVREREAAFLAKDRQQAETEQALKQSQEESQLHRSKLEQSEAALRQNQEEYMQLQRQFAARELSYQLAVQEQHGRQWVQQAEIRNQESEENAARHEWQNKVSRDLAWLLQAQGEERKEFRKLKREHQRLLEAHQAILRSRLWRLGAFFHRLRHLATFQPPGKKMARQEKVRDQTLEKAQALPGTPQPAVEIVVCVHNAPEEVRECLASLARHTDLNRHTLLLIDDGSGEETARFLREFVARHPCRLIRHEEAWGYTRSANHGLDQTTAPAVVLLNSDTVVCGGWLEALLEAAQFPGTACVGPLSNAASWQSIPHQRDEHTGWAVNEVPDGLDVQEFANLLRRHHQPLFPQVHLVNGFCLLITREALDAVGRLDEQSFPRGYGEEDDFAIRCLDAGFSHRIADHCYVFHQKSRSFTPEGRSALVQKSARALKQKHGRARLTSLVQSMVLNEELLRGRCSARGCRQREAAAEDLPPALRSLSILWPQPHLRTVGGIRRVIEMSNRLVGQGHRVVIATPEGKAPEWLPLRADVVAARKLATMTEPFDVVLWSDPDTVPLCRLARGRCHVVYHLAAYALYRQENENLKYFYSLPGAFHVANSAWTAEQIRHRVAVAGIFPGAVDHAQFRPWPQTAEFDVVCYGSTRPHKGTDTIVEACRGLRLLKLADINPPQQEMARHLCRGRVFVSACWHEGFNLCGLEAFACGVPVAMTDDGGSRDYVRNGENALVVPVGDAVALRAAIDRLLQDQELRLKVIEAGIACALKSSWSAVTSRFEAFLQNCLDQETPSDKISTKDA